MPRPLPYKRPTRKPLRAHIAAGHLERDACIPAERMGEDPPFISSLLARGILRSMPGGGSDAEGRARGSGAGAGRAEGGGGAAGRSEGEGRHRERRSEKSVTTVFCRDIVPRRHMIFPCWDSTI